MLATLLGIVTTIIPLILIFGFKNKTVGFLWIFSGITTFHLTISMVSQSLHLFSYPIIISLNIILAIISILIFIKNKYKIEIKKPKISTLLIFLIIFANLSFAHYLYTGKINTINGSEQTKLSFNKYPYFSDEWIAISLSKYSIENKSLPIVNPLNKNRPFPNPMFPYFSFISEIFLISKTNPVTSFVPLSIFFSLIISLLSFIFIKKLNISDISSTLTILSLPYITVGANLPGLWHLIPMNLGIIFMLVGLISTIQKEKKLLFLSSILSVIFYPPSIIFIIPIIISLYISKEKIISKKDFIFLLSFIIIGIILFSTILDYIRNDNIIEKINNLIFRKNLEPGIPMFNIFYILPIWTLIFSILGIFSIIKNKIFCLILPILTGSIFWLCYTQTMKVFIIDYPRVVVFMSILLTITSALGIEYLINKTEIKKYITKYEKIIILSIFSIFIILIPFYTKLNRWDKLRLVIKNNNKESKVNPAPPANKYLTDEDLKIFDNIKNKKFVSIAWKGLTIGASTGNFPSESKPSTIANRFLSYSNFIRADCPTKNNMVKKYKIDFVYSKEFKCDNFLQISKSLEGNILYKVK